MFCICFKCNNCPGPCIFFGHICTFKEEKKRTFCHDYSPKTVWLTFLIKMVLWHIAWFLHFFHCVEHFSIVKYSVIFMYLLLCAWVLWVDLPSLTGVLLLQKRPRVHLPLHGAVQSASSRPQLWSQGSILSLKTVGSLHLFKIIKLYFWARKYEFKHIGHSENALC